MVWDNTEYRLREFGLLKNTASAARKGEATNRWLCYIVWDVVYLGGGPKAEQLIREVFKGLYPLYNQTDWQNIWMRPVGMLASLNVGV